MKNNYINWAKISLLGLLFLCCFAFAYPTYIKMRTAKIMTDAAKSFIATLPDSLRAKAVSTFDDPLRDDWEFYPRQRKGLSIKEMNFEQRRAAHALLQSGLSSYGYLKVNAIMHMEPVLKGDEDVEAIRRNLIRDEELYYIVLWGSPNDAKWAWRIEGHHVSLHFTLANGELLANTPLGFGSSPAEARRGPYAGFRPLGNEEDKGREFIQSLDEKQREVAIFDKTITPGDMLMMSKVKVDPLIPAGISYTQLTEVQKALLLNVIQEYLARMPDEIAHARYHQLEKTGLKTLNFAWAGGLNYKQPHYYRIQSKTFVIEYDHSQTNSNHIHSVWRDFNDDFGYDWLQTHLKNEHGMGSKK